MQYGEQSDLQLNPDFIRAVAETQQAANEALLAQLPSTGFVASVNSQSGPLTLAGGAVGGVTINISPAAGTLTFTVSGLGTMAIRNAVAAVVDIVTTDAVDLPTAIALANTNKAKINELLGAMRTALHLTP